MKSKFFLPLICLLFAQQALAAIATAPLFATTKAEPRLLLVVSRDEQLSQPAYSDLSNLEKIDDKFDTSFERYIDYDGYFDPYKCYLYNNNLQRFEASKMATRVDEDAAVGSRGFNLNCGHDSWLGNFLNWATMTRMDLLRKALYGGYRSTDTAPTVNEKAVTVLERAYLPNDSHSFVKLMTVSNTREQQYVMPTPYEGDSFYVDGQSWTYGYQTSICNTSLQETSTAPVSYNTLSAEIKGPPIFRIKDGRWTNWANSGFAVAAYGGFLGPIQCHVDPVQGAERPVTLPPQIRVPFPQEADEYVVRIKVCDDVGEIDGLEGLGPQCKEYPKGKGTAFFSKKPVGILQLYGDPDTTIPYQFALITSSWGDNKSGGGAQKADEPDYQ